MMTNKIYDADLTRLPFGTLLNLFADDGSKWRGRVVENEVGISNSKAIRNIDTGNLMVITEDTNFLHDIELVHN